MDLEKDDVRNFEAAAQCGNSRKVPDFGLSRDAERPVASFGSVVLKVKHDSTEAGAGSLETVPFCAQRVQTVRQGEKYETGVFRGDRVSARIFRRSPHRR